MGNMFYIVTRVFYKGLTESHSIEIKTDRLQAIQRYYNIIAADLADSNVVYQFCSLTDCYGNYINDLRPVVYDRREAPAEEQTQEQ